MEEKQKSMRIAADIVRAAPNPAAWMYPHSEAITHLSIDTFFDWRIEEEVTNNGD